MAKEKKIAPALRDARRTKVIEALNKARAMELYAITQYMNQHYGLDDMDYGELARVIKLIAFDEMHHAEMLAERIKELDGSPTTVQEGRLERDQDVRRVYPFDAEVEEDVISVYTRLLEVCRENGDCVSAALLEDIIAEEQIHHTYFVNVDTHLKNLGDTYLANIAGTPSSIGHTTKGFAKGAAKNSAAS